MTLEPGALRELHWHANAAEWAYVLEGNCRVTTIDPLGQCEIVDFGPGGTCALLLIDPADITSCHCASACRPIGS